MRSVVYLVGFMGSGKTACGKALASRLDLDFADTDDVVVQRDGRPIARIFAESGEAFFRRLELEALRCLPTEAHVVATGGGLVTRPQAWDWMRSHGRTVWLDAPFDSVWRNVGPTDTERPLWTPDDRPGLERLFLERRALYAEADYRVQVGRGSVDAVVERIVRWWGRQRERRG